MEINLNFISTIQNEKTNIFKWGINGVFSKGSLIPKYIKDKNTLINEYGILPEMLYTLNNKNDGFYVNRIFSKHIKSAYSYFDGTVNGDYNNIKVSFKKIKILKNILPNELTFYDSGNIFDYSKIIEYSSPNYTNNISYYMINNNKIYDIDLISSDTINNEYIFETIYNFLSNNILIIHDEDIDIYYLKYCELSYINKNINNKSDFVFNSFVQYRKLLLENAYNTDDLNFQPNVEDNKIFIVSKIAGEYGNNISVKITGYLEATQNDFKKFPTFNNTNMLVSTYINNILVDEQISINLTLFENEYIKIITDIIYNDELNIKTTLDNGDDGDIDDNDIIESYIIYNETMISGTILYNNTTYVYNKIIETLPKHTIIIISDDINTNMINDINKNTGVIKSKFYAKIDNNSFLIPSAFGLIQLISSLYGNIDKYLIRGVIYDYLYFSLSENDNKYNDIIIEEGVIIQERLLSGDTITKRMLYNKVLSLISNISNNMMFKQLTMSNISVYFNQIIETLNNESNLNSFSIKNIKVYTSKIEFDIYITFYDNIENFVINVFGDFIV